MNSHIDEDGMAWENQYISDVEEEKKSWEDMVAEEEAAQAEEDDDVEVVLDQLAIEEINTRCKIPKPKSMPKLPSKASIPKPRSTPTFKPSSPIKKETTPKPISKSLTKSLSNPISYLSAVKLGVENLSLKEENVPKENGNEIHNELPKEEIKEPVTEDNVSLITNVFADEPRRAKANSEKTYRKPQRSPLFPSPNTLTTSNSETRISSPDVLNEKLKKTKMCYHIQNFGKCPHPNCNFAHSVSELRVGECIHGANCYLKTTKCSFIHPGESRRDYDIRLGFLPATPKKEACTNPKIEDKMEIEKIQEETKIEKELKTILKITPKVENKVEIESPPKPVVNLTPHIPIGSTPPPPVLKNKFTKKEKQELVIISCEMKATEEKIMELLLANGFANIKLMGRNK